MFPVAKKLSVTATFTRAGIAKFILLYTCVRPISFITHKTGLAPLRQLHSYVIARCSAQRRTTLATLQMFGMYSVWKSMGNYDTCASVFVVLFNGFMSLTSYFDVMYRY